MSRAIERRQARRSRQLRADGAGAHRRLRRRRLGARGGAVGGPGGGDLCWRLPSLCVAGYRRGRVLGRQRRRGSGGAGGAVQRDERRLGAQLWGASVGRARVLGTPLVDRLVGPPRPNGSAFGSLQSGQRGRRSQLRAAGLGVIECWGDNWHGDHGQTEAPAGRFSAVSSGKDHSCALRASGELECWGANHYGQAEVPAGRFSAVSAGSSYSCGVQESGAVECWGGTLRVNGTRRRDVSAQSARARNHTCGLRVSGDLECWGASWAGLTDAPSGRFIAVSAGDWDHSCGVRESGLVECWGRDDYGQADAPSGRFVAVSAGDEHSCGARESGAMECWGRNSEG